MGYLDRAKALMEEAGIDCVKSVTSSKSLPETSPLAERYRLKYPNDLAEYPHQPCQCGSGDYWPREASQWGKAEWVCSRCHPQPEGEQ